MNLLQQVQSGRRVMPPRILVYGTEGIGKSTLASQAPRPVFIQTEDGLDEIECDRFPKARALEDVLSALATLRGEEHPYQTVVVDSLDWLERLIWDAVCKEYHVNSIEKADGGYQRGYIHALTHWRKVVDALGDLREAKGMGVILTAHARIERFEDPESVSYDRYVPRLNKHSGALLIEWSDAVLFATRRFRTETEERGFGRERTIAKEIGREGGERILRTAGSPACVAKNRYGLPVEMPLSWPDLMAHLTRDPATPKGDETHG